MTVLFPSVEFTSILVSYLIKYDICTTHTHTGERCLAPDTDMCSLYKVNPNAQWVIKPRDWPDV